MNIDLRTLGIYAATNLSLKDNFSLKLISITHMLTS